ncbi:outer membrane receptor for ferrienterochelin and colicins [Frateuria aurantia DSM 6220]|uniref:Outer membrane receptor for ferrienterochelin and colicins n=2 Tax=Frateuria aurantia TaxID=81475 RepID=H8KYH4_FRAAD|nr:outer membrane receptor for ferrienterochelin and colicins [Frateuria aurantia DSM 6220]
MKSKRYSRAMILPIAIAASFASASGWAMDDGTATSAGQPASKKAPSKSSSKQMQAVIVTGTRSSGRTESESLSPIDVLGSKDLQATGANTVGQALSQLLPSLDFPSSAINGPLNTTRPVILRGMSPNYVLVLVDGKRYHPSSQLNYSTTSSRGSQPVDTASIPIAAIDHIEVLRDGAAAQYGSDAIAGVVNIVLKHGARKGDNSVTAGGAGYTKGGGAQNSISGSVGFDLGAQKKGWLRVSWNYLNAMPTNHAEFGEQNQASVVKANGGYATQVYGNAGQKNFQTVINFAYAFNPAFELYGYIDASQRDQRNYGYYRTANSSNNVKAMYPNGYLPLMLSQSSDFSAVLGGRGLIGDGWHWDFSGTYGYNNVNNQVDNTLNVALYENTGSSPRNFYVGSFRDAQSVFNLDVSKDTDWGFLPNPVTVAFGASWMKDQYQMKAGDAASYYQDPNGTYAGGAQTFSGITPAEAGNFSRHSQAVYADLETDLTDRLSAGVAARYEHYSDAGATRSGKVSLRYQLTDTLALRGTVSNGFRAPSLGQQYYETIATIINNNTLTQTGTFRTSNSVAQALGARSLRPEKSVNYSLGAVWQPLDNLDVSVDGYQIRIAHQDLLSDSFSLTSNPELAAYISGISATQVSAAQYFTNAATTRTRGVDMVTSYYIAMGNAGTLRLNASANYNQVSLQSVAATPAILREYAPTLALYGRASEGLLTKSTPRTKFVLGGTWMVGNWSFYAGETRYGSVMRVGNTAAGDQTFAARWLLDTTINYTYHNWTFTVGANNLTNQYPSRVTKNNTYDYYYGELPYSPLSPFGYNGRYVFGNVTLHW